MRMMPAGTSASTAALLLGVALALGALGACGPVAREPGTVVMASGADLPSANPLVTIHPLSRQVQRFVLFVTLARYDSALVPQPYLARAWEWSADGRTLTLRLHPGLHWHDGHPTTAADVVFTIDAARDPATGFPRAADLADLRSVHADDDSTVVLAFTRAPTGFPPLLAELPIVPRHLLADVPRAEMRRAAFGLAPVGNGPFRFVRREAGSRWIFERNDRFPAALGGPPRLSRLVIAVVDEATTKFAGLVSGELQVAGIAPTMAGLADEDPALRVLTYPVLFTTGIVFNTARPPFDDARVRHAVDLALQRERIVEAAVAGLATPAAGPVPPGLPLALAAQPRFDPARADSLLDAAGWRRAPGARWRTRAGVALRFDLLTVGSADNAIEQLVQADLAERGIRMEIRQLELAAFLAQAQAAERTFDALITGIPGDASLAYLAAMYDSRLAGGALDYGAFHTPTLDAAFAAVRAAADTTAARAAWHAVQRELQRELPATWVYHARGVQGLSARLRGVTMDLRGELPTVARWSLAPGDAPPP